MKSSSRCRKCGSYDIINIRGLEAGYGIGDNIKSGLISQAIVSKYLCCNCGYIEEWLDDLSTVEKIRQYQQKCNKH